MTMEERWAQNREWAEERRRGFDVEIKVIRKATPGDFCAAGKCLNLATKEYEVGDVELKSGELIPLCDDHDTDEMAYRIYNLEVKFHG